MLKRPFLRARWVELDIFVERIALSFESVRISVRFAPLRGPITCAHALARKVYQYF
jgi:hypothetical protein